MIRRQEHLEGQGSFGPKAVGLPVEGWESSPDRRVLTTGGEAKTSPFSANPTGGREMIVNYKVEVQNLQNNQWELWSEEPTLDKAFDSAEKAVGHSRDYGTVAILDMFDCCVWDSDGYRQAEGMKLPTLEEVKRAN